MLNPHVDEIAGDNQYGFNYKLPTGQTSYIFHKLQKNI